MKERRRVTEADAREELRHRQQPALAEEREELVPGGDERDEVDRGEAVREEEADQPEVAEVKHKLYRDIRSSTSRASSSRYASPLG